MGAQAFTPSVLDAPARYVLIGDGLSPHLLKWAQTLHEVGGAALQLHVISSRGLLEDWEPLISPERRLLLHTQPQAAGGNAGLMLHLPRVLMWLRRVRPTVLHAHYLTSHGTLAMLSQVVGRIAGLAPSRLIGSAWGSDILVTPQQSGLLRAVTSAVLRRCELSTSDSHHMAQVMREMGATRVMVFPFGLKSLPPQSDQDPHLYFSNRALESWYGVDRVLDLFATVAAQDPKARLVVAHTGRQRAALEQQVAQLGLQARVAFVGRLDAQEQARLYAQAQWYLSLPHSDSVSVSVLEAMAHGCIPVLSDLPANRELIEHGQTGWILSNDAPPGVDGRHPQGPAAGSIEAFCGARPALLEAAPFIAQRNRQWIQDNGLFAPRVRGFLQALGLL